MFKSWRRKGSDIKQSIQDRKKEKLVLFGLGHTLLVTHLNKDVAAALIVHKFSIERLSESPASLVQLALGNITFCVLCSL